MRNFIERIKSYSKRKDTADMAIYTWKSANEESYANFCKRMDAIGKGNLSILMDIYVSDDAGVYTARSLNAVQLAFRFCQREGCTRHRKPTMGWPIYRDYRPMYHKQTIVARYQRKNGDN